MRRSSPWTRACPAVLLLALACGERQLDTVNGGNEPGQEADDPGSRPHSPGSMYSACTDTSVCAPLEFCVFPQNEAGFCTAACGPTDDASTCNPAPAEDRDPICMDIGIPDGRTVCALGCDGLSCPRGMRCEEVAAAGGAQFACF